MSMHDAFLADILANPDDDTPRLVYADWLDEHGDPERAQFIRVQCRLARLGQYDLERYDLEGQEEVLWKKNEKKWRNPLAKVTARVTFRRGFPDVIALPVAKFITHAEEAFAAAPTLREYRVLQPGPVWDKLMRCEALARLRSLDAGHHRLGVARVQALARCPHIANLRELSLSSSAMRPSGMTELAAWRHLANLRKLDLMSSHIGDVVVERIAESPYLKGLTELDLSGNELTPAGIARLAGWEGASRLEALAINESDQGNEAARAFAAGEWPALRRLELHLSRITEAGMEALGRCRSLAGLRSLRVPIYGRLLRALAVAPSLANVEDLNVDGTADEETLAALAGSPLMANLRSASLYGTKPEGLEAILSSPSSAVLRELTLQNPAGTGHLGRVAEATHLVNLRRLSIINIRVGLDEVRQLASAPHLAGLVKLNLAACGIPEEAARELVASPHLNRLREVSLYNHPVLLKGAIVDALTERFGKVTVG